MSVTNTSSKTIYVGTGLVATYAFTWNIWLATDLVLTRIAVDGTETTLALNSDYTVALSHAAPTPGTITLLAGNLAAGVSLVIQRVLPITQQINITDYSATPAATWNEAYDRAVMLIQQVQEQVSRSVLQAVNATVSFLLPPPSAGKVIGWNSAGTALENATPVPGPTGATGATGADGKDGVFTAIASQAEAEAGTENTKGMTALRTAEAITAQTPSPSGKVSGDGTVNPVNLLGNANFESWVAGTSVAPDLWTSSGIASIARDAAVKIGTYSCKIVSGVGQSAYAYQDVSVPKGINYWKGRTVTFSCWVKTNVSGKAFISFYGGFAASTAHTGSNTWELLKVTGVVPSDATVLAPTIIIDGDNNTAYFDGAMMVEGASEFAFSSKPAIDPGIPVGGTASAGAGKQYFVIQIGGVNYKVLHDGTA